MSQSIFLYRRILQFVSSTGWLIGHGNDTYYIISALNKGIERGNGEVGRSHIYDSKILRIH